MSVTDLASFREVRDKEKKQRRQQYNRAQPRYLGGKNVHFAMYTYKCCRCINPIVPGDEYRRERFVRSYQTEDGEKSYFRYERYHLPQCYGPTEDEYRRIQDDMERQRSVEEKKSERHAA
ncbi:MAG: hypothetical protein R3B53_04595 [Candidatus Paceibacterota bacterium]